MKRLFFRVFAIGTLIAALCLLWGFLIEPKTLKTRIVTVTSEHWRGDPIRIGVVTDIHIGGWHVDSGRVKTVAEHMMAQSPDIIVIPGDFIDGHDRREDRSAKFNAVIDDGLAALSTLDAPLGVYASIGNHDAWYDGPFVSLTLEQHGITVIENAADTPMEALCLVGLADTLTGTPDISVFEACQEGQFKLAIAHSPDVLLLGQMRQGQEGAFPADLLIAGHTHGGQINLPLLGRAVTATKLGKPYAYGLTRYGQTDVFISAGIGTSILPARFRAPPEIVMITLQGQ